jgi:hypothetical protein
MKLYRTHNALHDIINSAAQPGMGQTIAEAVECFGLIARAPPGADLGSL